MTQVYVRLLEISGLDLYPLAFAISAKYAKCSVVDDILDCLMEKSEKYGGDPGLMVEYPQVMEFIELWFFIRAPKFVVDQLLRHRHLSAIVSSVRHGRPVPYLDGYGDELADIINETLKASAKLIDKCLSRGLRPELCHRLLPPLIDERGMLLKVNLRQLAHMYCIRKHGGAQREHVELLEKVLGEIGKVCGYCAKAVMLYCSRWGYQNKHSQAR